MEQYNTLANVITKALAYTENGGQPDISKLSAGKSGELKSVFQFTPETWKKDAGTILGNENAPISPENEVHVVHSKVTNWLKQGYNARQIASMWNAGEGEPHAESGKFSNGNSSTGTNKEGVNFDVKGYADKVQKYATQFYGELNNQQSNTQGNGSLQGTVTGNMPKSKKPRLVNNSGLLGQSSNNKTNNKV